MTRGRPGSCRCRSGPRPDRRFRNRRRARLHGPRMPPERAMCRPLPRRPLPRRLLPRHLLRRRPSHRLSSAALRRGNRRSRRPHHGPSSRCYRRQPRADASSAASRRFLIRVRRAHRRGSSTRPRRSPPLRVSVRRPPFPRDRTERISSPHPRLRPPCPLPHPPPRRPSLRSGRSPPRDRWRPSPRGRSTRRREQSLPTPIPPLTESRRSPRRNLATVRYLPPRPRPGLSRSRLGTRSSGKLPPPVSR
jgi:hypothetical protein